MNTHFPLDNISNNFSFTAVTVTGTAQPFEAVKTVLPKDASGQKSHVMHTKQWEKHLNELKKLSIFAGQAAEYEYNKNKTEGKTGIAKPDLIQSTKRSVHNVSESHLSTTSASVSDLVQTINSPRTSPRTSPLKIISETFHEENVSVDYVPLNSNDETPKAKCSSNQSNEYVRPKLVRSKGSLINSKPPNILVYSDSIVSRDSVISTLKDILRENT